MTFIAVREIITRAEASRREEQYMANGYELIIISTMRVKILTTLDFLEFTANFFSSTFKVRSETICALCDAQTTREIERINY